MNTSVFREMPVGELLGQIIRTHKKKSGVTTPEFESYVIDQELPKIIELLDRRLSVKRLHKHEGKFLGLGKKPSKRNASLGEGELNLGA
jgi:hypothetical protein